MGNAAVLLLFQPVLAVHPHGCGERVFVNNININSSGSSPRVWGTLTKTVLKKQLFRFIPTGVGNAWNAKEIGDIPPVHPHGCGERTDALKIKCRLDGSSPRVWGTLIHFSSGSCGCRFIPTGVGNAHNRCIFRYTHAVHPHGCGERNSASYHLRGFGGSSPRVWGTPQYE